MIFSCVRGFADKQTDEWMDRWTVNGECRVASATEKTLVFVGTLKIHLPLRRGIIDV